MPGKPRIAVIIVNWNSGELLGRCLDCLRGQDQPPARVLVIDNNSSDESLAAARRAFPEYEYHALDENIGFAAANNLGIGMVEDCEWVALLNPDAFAERTWLRELSRAIESKPDFSSFASLMMMSGDDGRIDGAGDVYHASGLAWRRFHKKMSSRVGLGSCEVFSPCAGAAVYRRTALLEAGGFDEDFFCYFEDVDLGARMRLRGHRCWFASKAVVTHIGSAVTGGISGFAVFHGHRNLEWAYVKNMPLPLLLLTLPLHIVMVLILVPYFLFKGGLSAYLRAKLSSFAGIMPMIRKRRAIQKNRRIGMIGFLRKLSFTLVPPAWRR